MNSNADGQADAVLLLQTRGKGSHGLEHCQAGPHGALGVVFVR